MLTTILAITAACFAIAALLGAWSLQRRLTNLRNNCHLRTEKGHIRRYEQCSAEVRARAEQA